MCDNRRAQGHLGPLHNNKVSWGRKVSEKRHTHRQHTHTHTHTQFHRGPSLLMHDRSIMHFYAFTHRWQDNRFTEKKDLGRLDLPRLWEQPDSVLHHKRSEEEQLNSPVL